MRTTSEKTDRTAEKYAQIARDFVAQYINDTGPEPGLEYTEYCALAATWFLDRDDRWSASYIRLLAAALTPMITNHRDWELTTPRRPTCCSID